MSGLDNAQSNAVAEMLRITPVVERLHLAFAAAGHELYLVGGSVRDALLGRLGHDLDFTTGARPDDIEPILRAVVADGAEGSGVWDIGRRFGTIGARLMTTTGEDWIIEVTTFRSDAYDPASRKPEVNFGDTLEGDLGRRDFTVNAMAIRCADHQFVDPFGGLSDLAAMKLTTPGSAERSFSDDPLRMLRAARFSAQLGFSIDPAVVAAMSAMAQRIDIISAERVREEFTKIMLSPDPRTGLGWLVSTGLAGYVLPELPALRLERDEHHRHKDVFEHSLTVLDQAIALEKSRGHKPDLVLRLASLLHDIGKPKTRAFEPGGKVSFHHHDVVGAKMVRKRLPALKFSKDVTRAVALLVELHLRFHGYRGPDGVGVDAGPVRLNPGADPTSVGEWTDSAVRRYVRDADDQLERLHILTRADCTTRNQRKAERLRRAYDDLERRIHELAEADELAAVRPDLDGGQIMKLLKISPGPVVGEAYRFLLELRLNEGPQSPEQAEAALLHWWGERDS